MKNFSSSTDHSHISFRKIIRIHIHTPAQDFSRFCKLPNGDVLATADIWDTVPFPFQSSRVAFVRMDSTGNIIWSKMLPQTHNYSLDVSADAFGCDILNGHNYCSLVHCDTINQSNLECVTLQIALRVLQLAGSICHPAPNKGCYVAGSHTSNAPNDDLIWVMKI